MSWRWRGYDPLLGPSSQPDDPPDWQVCQHCDETYLGHQCPCLPTEEPTDVEELTA